MKTARRRIDVNLEELDRVLDDARQAPLSEADHSKLKGTLHAMAALLVRSRNTEKTSEVVEKPEESESETQADNNTPPPPGHGRNGRGALPGMRKWQCVRAERAEGVGASDWSGAAGSYRLLTGTVALWRLRAGLHGTGAGRSGA